MILELHLLQNFAVSNLNRDDTGAPKDCFFGDVRRARISSQCLKRAMRRHVRNAKLMDEGELGHRTKRLITDELPNRLPKRPAEEVRAVAERLLAGVKLKLKDGKTQYLIFFGEREIAGIAKLVDQHWATLSTPGESADAKASKKSAKAQKKEDAEKVPPELVRAVQTVLDGGKSADLAMFGRMLADLPEHNIDAACQVSHAIAVNKLNIDSDYYTAVDDLKPDDTAGADMIGNVDLTSACYYRYLNVHTGQLLDNLQGDANLARRTVEAFLKAAVEAVPTGKQNGTAAHNPPSLVMAVVRPTGCWNLANAFAKPVDSFGDGLIANAITQLDRQWDELTRMYSAEEMTIAVCASPDDALKKKSGGEGPHTTLASSLKKSVKEVLDAAVKALKLEAAK